MKRFFKFILQKPTSLDRLFLLAACTSVLIPALGSFRGEWPAFKTSINAETICSKKICKQNPEWKKTEVSMAKEVMDGPIPLIKNFLVPKLCFAPTGTGAANITSLKVQIVTEKHVVRAEYMASNSSNCIYAPNEQLLYFPVEEVKFDASTQEKIDTWLLEAGKNNHQGTDDQLLEEYSFDLEGEFKLTWIGLFLLYFICIIASYLAIELAEKTVTWVKTGKHT